MYKFCFLYIFIYTQLVKYFHRCRKMSYKLSMLPHKTFQEQHTDMYKTLEKKGLPCTKHAPAEPTWRRVPHSITGAPQVLLQSWGCTNITDSIIYPMFISSAVWNLWSIGNHRAGNKSKKMTGTSHVATIPNWELHRHQLGWRWH